MLKKLLTMLMCLILCFSVIACSGQGGAFACHSSLSPMEEFRSGEHGAKGAFEYARRDKDGWKAMYSGNKTVTEDPNVTYKS